MRKIKKLTGLVDQPPKSHWHKYPVRINWRWEGYRIWDEERWGPIEKATFDPPMFMTWRTAEPYEAWPIELIRRKYFYDLRNAKDYQRDQWMPKAMSIIRYILTREMISLQAVAEYLGMPERYLHGLSRRDENFRKLVAYWREDNDIHKSIEALESKAHGQGSMLQRLRLEHNGTKRESPKFPYYIDIGWKPREYARRERTFTNRKFKPKVKTYPL